MTMFPNSLPGVGSGFSLTPRMLFIVDTETGDFLPGGMIVDGFAARDPDNTIRTDEIRPGLVLGKITGTGNGTTAATVGQLGASILGTLQAAVSTASTAMTLTLAAAREVVRRIGSSGTLVLTGPPTTTGTVAAQNIVFSAVTTATGVLTITAPTAAAIAGSFIGAGDGSEVPFTIFCGDVYPMRVTDVNDANQPTPLRLIPITSKPLYTTNIINYPSNAKLKAYLKSSLRTAVPGMAFSDDFE